MNLEVQPILTVLVNVLVGLLVSKGIIDSASQPQISQEINNVLAALVTLGLGLYSTHRVMDAYKHKMTIAGQTSNGSSSVTMTNPTSPVSTDTTTTLPQQTGLPATL